MKRAITISGSVWLFMILNIIWTQGTINAGKWSTPAGMALTAATVIGIAMYIILQATSTDTED